MVITALVRARFCELLSPKIHHGDSDLFLMGLLSLMDSILEIPIADVVSKIALDQETGRFCWAGPAGCGRLYQLMLAQESGEWEQAGALAQTLCLQESDAAEAYWQAMEWAREVSKGA